MYRPSSGSGGKRPARPRRRIASEISTGLTGGKKQGPSRKHNTPKQTHKPSTKHKARSTQQGTQRQDAPYRYGPPDRFPDLSDNPEFAFGLVRATGEIVELRHVESVTWEDTTAIMTGSLTLREPVFSDDPTPVPDQGDRVICLVNEGGGFRELWMLRVYRPKLAVEDRQYTYDLVSDLDLLRQSEGYFKFHPDKKHPHGWRPDQIIAEVCRRYHVKIGRLYKSAHRRKRVTLGAHGAYVSPLFVIRKQLIYELRHRGPRLVTRYDGDRLSVTPLRRSPHLLKLGPTLTQAAFSSELPPEYASTVIVRGLVEIFDNTNANQPKNIQKAHVRVESAASRKRFGYVQRIVFSPDATTDAGLRREGKAYLTAIAKPHKRLTLTHPGIPHIRRGDAIRLALGDEGLRKQIVWVYEVSHSLTPEGYTMQLTVIFDDPYRDLRGEKIIWKLKATHDEAVGNRAKKNPVWWAKSQKDDISKPSKQGSAFADAFNRVFQGGGH